METWALAGNMTRYTGHVMDVIKELISKHVSSTYQYIGLNDRDLYDELIPYPVNFDLKDDANILEVLPQIAFQSKCKLTLNNRVFKFERLS